MTILGLLLKASYQLRRHLWAGLPLDRWLAVLLLMGAGLMAPGLIPGGVAGAVICAVLLAFVLALPLWAQKRSYLAFHFTAGNRRPDLHPTPLSPSDKLSVRATGLFEVEGKERSFTELQAYFRSFQTREHAIMAVVPASRLLLVGQWPAADAGMWYIFFKSTELRQIAAGDSYFGRQPRPALRLTVEQTLPPKHSPLEAWGVVRSDKPKPRLRQQVIYLSFDSTEARDRVLANLLADASGFDAYLQ
jgi:hypothetical protein